MDLQSYLPQIVLLLSVLVVALSVIVVVFWLGLRKLSARIEALTVGKDGTSLEQSIVDNGEKLARLDTEMQEFYHVASTIHALAQKGIHRIGFLRFNPFKDLGGDQSFALALMDGKANGVVISSLHTRESTRVYAKSIVGGDAAQHPFSDEEQQAVQSALTDSKSVCDAVDGAMSDIDDKNGKDSKGNKK